jgi:hypothetical protein
MKFRPCTAIVFLCQVTALGSDAIFATKLYINKNTKKLVKFRAHKRVTMAQAIVAIAEAMGPCSPFRGYPPVYLGTVHTESEWGPRAIAILRIWGSGDQWLIQQLEGKVPSFATIDVDSEVGRACTGGALGPTWVVCDRYGTGKLYSRRWPG